MKKLEKNIKIAIASLKKEKVAEKIIRDLSAQRGNKPWAISIAEMEIIAPFALHQTAHAAIKNMYLSKKRYTKKEKIRMFAILRHFAAWGKKELNYSNAKIAFDIFTKK